ncbi:MAG: hypothetical protein OEM02_06115 [Desulfobulbaceae bacterium]|nr:hypothetical protein [Desulfobulbaceae bacterium]
MQLIILALLWIVWCLLHSLLIEEGGVLPIKSFCGGYFRYYRIFYIIFSFASLLLPLYYYHCLSPIVFYTFQGNMLVIPILLMSYGVVMIYFGCRDHDLSDFLGIYRARSGDDNMDEKNPRFCSTGILAQVRHPWYGGSLALIWAVGSLSDVSLIVKVILSLYLFIGARIEEHRLLAKFGYKYARYCEGVPRFLPKLYRLKGGRK